MQHCFIFKFKKTKQNKVVYTFPTLTNILFKYNILFKNVYWAIYVSTVSTVMLRYKIYIFTNQTLTIQTYFQKV